jgi:hypothetical protein
MQQPLRVELARGTVRKQPLRALRLTTERLTHVKTNKMYENYGRDFFLLETAI